MGNHYTSQIYSGKNEVAENDESKLSDIASKSNEYRWFWNSSQDPWDKTREDHLWAQYELDLSDQIEQSYLSQLPQHDLNAAYIIIFDYQTEHRQHLQMHKVDQWKQRPVIRQIPSKISKTLRIDRWNVTQHEPFKMYENNFIDQLQMFCYSKIFLKFQIDKSDYLIQQFTSYVTILDKKIASMLETDYVSYLQNTHQLQYFDFNKLKDILSKDLKDQKEYISYVNNLNQNNFTETIIKMYTEEGQLYKNLNQVIRSMSLDQHMEYFFFFLCFLYVQGTHTNRINKDVTVYRGIGITNEVYEKFKTMYAVDQVVINYDFMSTSRNQEIVKAFIYRDNLPKKILFEIHIEKESDSNPLSFKPYDVANMSIFPQEEEIILPPNGVFQVSNFLEEGNDCDYSTIQMEYRTNLFNDSLPFILNESQLAHQFGLYNGYSGIPKEDFQQIVSLTNWNEKMNFELLSKMINLHYLNLSENEIGDEGMKAFASQLIHLTQLQQLDLRRNWFGDEGMKVFASQLSHLTQLQKLDLSENKIRDEEMKAFASQLSHLTQLQKLDLTGNKIGAEGMKAFASQLSHLTQLQQLDLSKNKIGNEGMKAFASQLSHLTQLEYLHLSWNKIEDEGMIAFASQLSHLTQLQELDLSWNKIEDEGMIAFASQLSHLTQLQELNLNRNEILAEGMKTMILQKLISEDSSWRPDGFYIFTRREKVLHQTKKELFTQQFTSKMKDFVGDEVKITKAQYRCIQTFQYYQNVKRMDLSENEIGAEGMKVFASQLIHLTQLQQLDLFDNKIGDEGMKAFASQLIHLTQLQQLNLSSNWLEDEGMKVFASQLSHLTQLHQLNLSSNWLEDDGMKAFASQLSHLTQLQKLDLRNNVIGAEGMKAFASQLNHLAQLQKLDLSENKIRDEGMIAFASQLSHLTQLQQMNLRGNKIGAEGMKAFASQLSHLTQLQQFDLSKNKIGDEGMKEFASQLSHLTQLQKLDLRRNWFGDEGMIAFASELSHLTQLQKMDLNRNKIGDEGMKAFASQLIHLTQLQQLDLGRNEIGKEGMIAFASQLSYLTQLQYLNLRLNQIGDEEMKAFASQLIHLTQLQQLDLHGNKIGDEGMIALKLQIYSI